MKRVTEKQTLPELDDAELRDVVGGVGRSAGGAGGAGAKAQGNSFSAGPLKLDATNGALEYMVRQEGINVKTNGTNGTRSKGIEFLGG